MSSKTSIYVFVGPPGAGKGTLSRLCVERLGWTQLSTGNLCRRHISEQTNIGRQIDFAIKSGKLVSDELIIDMVHKWIEEQLGATKAIILDGYPRTAAQAEALDSFVAGHADLVDLHIVVLQIDDEQVKTRLSGRYICQNKECQAVYSVLDGSSMKPKKGLVCDCCASELARRPDDRPEVIGERLRSYHDHADPLLAFYQDNGWIAGRINAARALPEVFGELKKIIGH